MRDQSLEKAIKEAGGPAELGRKIGTSSQAISQWQRCPAERVLQVERATEGKVTRHQLRPDLYPADEPKKGRAA
jgi:DNA-binding transcriptional regulator YdaS (Cro superfamily)